MPHFFVNSTLILVGVLGLFIMALMLFSYRSNVFVNLYLVIIFTICSIRNIGIGIHEITQTHFLVNSRLITPFFLVVAPCLFLYFKSLVKDYEQIYKKDLVHFICPALNVVLSMVQIYWQVLDSPLVENIRFVTLLVFFSYYLMCSFNLLYKNLWHKRSKKSVATAHYLLIKNWTLFMFVIASFLVVRILFSIYSEKMEDELFRGYNYSFLIIIPWLLVYGKILINPEILYGYPKLKRRLTRLQNQANFTDHVWIFDLKDISNPQDKKLSSTIEERVVPYISEIENFVENHYPFRNPNYGFSDFAKALHIPTSHLNYIFKYHAIVTFVEYKNYCRIKDALGLIDEGDLDMLTLEGLASKVGFSSYNAFFTAFKKQTKLSPKDYLSSKNNNNVNLQDVQIDIAL